MAWRFRKNLHTVFTRDSLRDRSLFTGPQRLNINGRHVFHRDRSSASCKIIKLANEIQLKTAVLRNRETITIEPVRLRYNWINERSGPCDSTVSLYEFRITTRQEKRSLTGFTIDQKYRTFADVRRYRRLFGTRSVVELAMRSMVEN